QHASCRLQNSHTSHLLYIILIHNTYTTLPYTTLFRSVDAGRGNFEGVFASDRVGGVHHLGDGAGEPRAVLDVHLAIGRTLRHDLDRKSTRLNSSHDQISYAVFCLK